MKISVKQAREIANSLIDSAHDAEERGEDAFDFLQEAKDGAKGALQELANAIEEKAKTSGEAPNQRR